MVLIGQAVTEKIKFYILFVNEFGQGQEMTLTFYTHNTSLAQHVVCIYHFSGLRLQSFLKNSMFSLFFH